MSLPGHHRCQNRGAQVLALRAARLLHHQRSCSAILEGDLESSSFGALLASVVVLCRRLCAASESYASKADDEDAANARMSCLRKWVLLSDPEAEATLTATCCHVRRCPTPLKEESRLHSFTHSQRSINYVSYHSTSVLASQTQFHLFILSSTSEARGRVKTDALFSLRPANQFLGVSESNEQGVQ